MTTQRQENHIVSSSRIIQNQKNIVNFPKSIIKDNLNNSDIQEEISRSRPNLYKCHNQQKTLTNNEELNRNLPTIYKNPISVKRQICVSKNEINYKMNLIRKNFISNHPVVKLLEKNLKKSKIHHIIFNNEGMENFKGFIHPKIELLNKFSHYQPKLKYKNVSNLV